jgi:hypothetical protein
VIHVKPFRTAHELFADNKVTDGKELFLQKQVAICPEGVDTSIFHPEAPQVLNVDFKAPFNSLCVGLGMDKAAGEDRKNITNLVKWF